MHEQEKLILVVDDDPGVLDLVSVALRLEGFRVTAAAEGNCALRLARDEQPALVILDVMMPGADGYVVCHGIRQFSDVPIIMLTAKGGTDDIVHGLDLGADDYVVKPFDVNELAARVKTVLHRSRPRHEMKQNTPVSGDLFIDFGQHSVKVADRETPLPPIGYRLLCLLAGNAGRVVTYGHLLSQVWGPEYRGEDIHVLEAAVARLRKRLADGCGDHNYIGTRRGIGYFFNAPNGGCPNGAAYLAAA
jgi:DNA-binding response OmpR family regulator